MATCRQQLPVLTAAYFRNKNEEQEDIWGSSTTSNMISEYSLIWRIPPVLGQTATVPAIAAISKRTDTVPI